MSSENADTIHGTEKNEGEAKGRDNLINMFVGALYVLIFVVFVYAIYMVTASYIMLVFSVLLSLLMLYAIKQLSRPRPKKHKELDNKMMCKNGHIVSVYVNYDGGISQGSNNLDVTCGASVWPNKCPICGASWRRPGK